MSLTAKRKGRGSLARHILYRMEKNRYPDGALPYPVLSGQTALEPYPGLYPEPYPEGPKL